MVEFDFRAMDWPVAPLDASAYFLAHCLPQVREMLAGEGMWEPLERPQAACVILPEASHEHHSWRIAAVEELAREAAPVRINGIVGGSDEALEEVVAYLDAAPGVTGQVLEVADASG